MEIFASSDGTVVDIKVPPDVLIPGGDYTFILGGRTPDGRRIGEAALDVTVNTRPHSGRCEIDVNINTGTFRQL